MLRKIQLNGRLAIIKSFELWKCLLHVGWTVVEGDVHSDCGEEEGLRGFIWPDNVTTANQTNANQTSGTQTYEVLPLPKGDDDLVYKAQLMSIFIVLIIPMTLYKKYFVLFLEIFPDCWLTILINDIHGRFRDYCNNQIL